MMKKMGYLILSYLSALSGCSLTRNSCANESDHSNHSKVQENNYLQENSDCTVTYSDSKKQIIDLAENCRRAVVINSGSGNLIIRSSHTLDSLTIINSGSNNANLSGILAKQVNLQDRGSGNLQVSSITEISGISQGSGTIIISGPGKNSIINKGSGVVIES